jgi:hypothetical protein
MEIKPCLAIVALLNLPLLSHANSLSDLTKYKINSTNAMIAIISGRTKTIKSTKSTCKLPG